MRLKGRSKAIALLGGAAMVAGVLVAPTVSASSVVATIPLPAGQGYAGTVATNSNVVWVGRNQGAPTVYRVDSSTNTVVATVNLPGTG